MKDEKRGRAGALPLYVRGLTISDVLYDILNHGPVFGVTLHFGLYLLYSVDDSGVIPSSKFQPDSSHRHLGDIPNNVDG